MFGYCLSGREIRRVLWLSQRVAAEKVEAEDQLRLQDQEETGHLQQVILLEVGVEMHRQKENNSYPT